MTLLNVVDFPVPDYKDPATMLRNIAAQIEAGDFGAVGCVAVALLGDTFEVFGGGQDSAGPSVGMMFHAGLARLSREIEQHGVTS